MESCAPRLLPSANADIGHQVAEVMVRIRVLAGRRAILDSDLAAIYGVPRRELLECFHRHEPVPGDYRFTPDERDVPRNQLGERRHAENFAFTEHGCFMAAILLNTRSALAKSVHIVRAFAALRQGRDVKVSGSSDGQWAVKTKRASERGTLSLSAE